LSTEEEWERAARGQAGREYAWGDSFDQDQLNAAGFWNRDAGNSLVKDRDIASTTLVGQFPDGNTPEGVADLCGNVWEWTNSWYESGQVNRTLRGGAWNYARRDVRSAYRYRDVPDHFTSMLVFVFFPWLVLDPECWNLVPVFLVSCGVGFGAGFPP